MKWEELESYEREQENIDYLVDVFEDVKDELCKSVRVKREALGVSLRSFATKIGVSAPYLSDIELGRRFPSEKILQKIKKELN